MTLSLRSESTDGPELTVSRTALLYDVHGGTWVYEQLGTGVFARHRVEVERVAGDLAVLSRGPEPGTVVVVDGAAELYGTEFGVAH